MLLDEQGLVVLESVMEAVRGLTREDYAAYAPILGLPEYLEAVKTAVFLEEPPEGCYVKAVIPLAVQALSATRFPHTQYLETKF